MNTARPDVYFKSGSFLLLSVFAINVLLTVTLFICGYLEAWHVPHFEQRFAPTIAVAHGQQIYRIPPDGPLIVCLYGPLSYLAYLPAAFLPTVQSVFAAGSLMATAFLVVPFAFLGYLYVRKYRLPLRDWGPLLLFPLAAIASLRPLNYIASFVTADSPSTCLMALSVIFLYRDRNQSTWKTAAYSSLALVLSLGCKQNMAFAALVVVLAVFYFFGRRFGWSYLAFTSVFAALGIGLVIAVYRDVRAIFFNSVLAGLHMSIVKANLFPGTYRLFENMAVLALTLTGMGLILFLTKGSISWPSQSRFILTFFVVTAVLSFSGIRFYAVVAGDVNDLSHAIYFFVLAIVVSAFELLLLTRDKPQAVTALRILIVAATLALFGSGLPLRYNAQWKTRVSHTPSGIEAYEYDKQNPGYVYFPYNTIGVYFAEHKFYMTEWGVVNLEIANERFTRDEIVKYIPRNARYIAMPRDYIVDDPGAIVPFVAPHHLEASIPGLKDFVVFSIER